jgi:hypothetical protein
MAKYKKNFLALTANPIPYCKDLREISGSVNAAILFQQLEYWFVKTEGKSFYKFLESLAKEENGYKKGDSWTEELAFSPKEFRTAFGKIGIAHKCKSDYDKAVDKFRGMMYCSYHNKRNGKTYYFRNQKIVDENMQKILKGSSVDDQSSLTETPNGVPANTETTSETIAENKKVCTDCKSKSFAARNFVLSDNSEMVTIYRNENAGELSHSKNNRIISVQATRKGLDEIKGQIAKTGFSQINESFETLLGNEQQMEAIERMITNPKIGISDLRFIISFQAQLKRDEENGFEHRRKISEAVTPMRVERNIGPIKSYYRGLMSDEAYQNWRCNTYPEEYPQVDDEEMERFMSELQAEGVETSRVLNARWQERQKKKKVE